MKNIKLYRYLILASFIASINGESKKDPHILQAAILNDSPEEIQMAINAGADVNKNIETQSSSTRRSSLNSGQSPLFLAYSLQHQKAVQALLDAGAKPDANVIQKALYAKDFNTIVLFLKAGAVIPKNQLNQYMDLCLNALSSNESVALEVMQEIIDRGYNINNIWQLQLPMSSSGEELDINRDYPTVEAINFYLHEKAVHLALKNGANPNFIYVKGIYSCTPLLKAIATLTAATVTRGTLMKDIPATIKLLVDASAKVNQKANPYPATKSLLTPTTLAHRRAHFILVDFLTSHGGTL